MIPIHCRYDKLVSPKSLKPHPRNRNQHSTDQIDRLAKLINYQGIRAPIVVSKLSGYICKGHGTLMALNKLKLKEVPIVEQEFENEDAEYSFLTADNAIASWADLDLAGINQDMEILGPDFDLEMLGLKDFNLDFSAGTEDEQGKLDQLKTVIMECPHCGVTFEKRQAKIID